MSNAPTSKHIDRTHLRRGLLLVVDISIISVMFVVSWLLFRQRFDLPGEIYLLHWVTVVVSCGLFLVMFRCYDSLWRYADGKEYLMQFLAMSCGFLLYFALDSYVIPREMHYSGRFMLFAVMMALIGMWLFRFAYRYMRQMALLRAYKSRQATEMVIVGAGDAGVSLADEILRNSSSHNRVVGFFDDNTMKHNTVIHGVPVLGSIDQMAVLLEGSEVKEIVVAIPSLDDEGRRRVLQLCSQTKCRVRILPQVSELLDQSGPGLFGNIRDVSPEDLLGREAIFFDNEEIYDFLTDKTVMVTGGGGSIGSELCRQIAAHDPRRLIIVDIYENNAYEVQQELYREYSKLELHIEIASVRDTDKVNYLFRKYRPQIVFHAAAHKHVPLMEDCPEEAIKNNVFGTYNVAKAANVYGADKFILISTDKAVNPTNVMGASKRLCEMIMQSMQDSAKTKYVAVRFGNVLGSNGSVIPLFKQQLAHGGPITVTDRRIIRYFMTIPEAAQLVMQAGAIADCSQVFVLDMGEPVKILSLAENLVRLAGYTPYQDIDIIETGLRPGEKLYEELLMKSEHLTATKNHKIFIEQQEPISHQEMQDKLRRLRDVLALESPDEVVRVMHEIVPTFKRPEEVNAQVNKEPITV